MRKKIVLIVLISLLTTSVGITGGLLTNTNQSAHFLRNPARDASIQIDAAYTNPAGLTKLSDGFHFSFSNQSAFQTRTITSTFKPFAGFGGNETKEFKGEASAPIVPSLQAAYKKGRWVLSGNIAVAGGGGKATFNSGLPSFESSIALLPNVINQLGMVFPGGIIANQYSVDAYMKGSSFIYGAQLGGSYEISKMFSAYGGFRLNIVNNGYKGYLRSIMVNPKAGNPAFGDGTMIPASEYFSKLSQIQSLPENVRAQLSGLAVNTKNKELDCTQSGWGISPILGFNFNWKNLNIGAKYEFKTKLNVENNTKIDDTGLFKDGVNTPHDIPALFTIGAAYQITSKLNLSIGYHHFFDSNARMADVPDKNNPGLKIGKQNYISGGTNEYLAGIEFQINKMFLVSAGGQITRQGVKDEYQSDLSFALNSYSIGLGGAINVSKSVIINIGYFWTNYSDWEKSPGAGTTKDVFSRTNKVFGAGVDFSF